jgi:L-alanine-DL-glutamate epimerase-like enolase superfamily enzyme
VGIQKNIDTLVDVVGGYLEDGYQRIKLKIKPGWDIEPTRAIRERWPNLKLQVDANSIYHLSDADHLAKHHAGQQTHDGDQAWGGVGRRASGRTECGHGVGHTDSFPRL